MKRKYRVLLPIEIPGPEGTEEVSAIYGAGSTVELDLETAKLYGHALIACEHEEAAAAAAAEEEKLVDRPQKTMACPTEAQEARDGGNK